MELRIEILRNGAWSERAAADVASVPDDRIKQEVERYAASSFYAHRAFADGRMVCEVPGGVKQGKGK